MDENGCEVYEKPIAEENICEVCGKLIAEGAGEEFIDRSCGYRYILCDDCIKEGD